MMRNPLFHLVISYWRKWNSSAVHMLILYYYYYQTHKLMYGKPFKKDSSNNASSLGPI
jgi:hypothetical protein